MTPAWDARRLRDAAATILSASLRAADPTPLVLEHLNRHRRTWGAARRVLVLAVGKAATAMAVAAESGLGERIAGGLVVDSTRRATGPSCLAFRVAGHPLPDARGIRAARQAEALVQGLAHDDLLLVLLSGGASALLPAPVESVTFEEKAQTTTELLRCGATVHEINTVRKHLSRLKGGGLARLAHPARVLCLALSDVVDDDLATIGSGPTVPDPTRFADALAVLSRYRLRKRVPSRVLTHLREGAEGLRRETAKPGEASFRRVTTRVIGSNALCLAEGARAARRLGLRPQILTAGLVGEARDVAPALVAELRRQSRREAVCLLAGGETTVRVRSDGLGGRNQEMVLAAALPLSRCQAPAVFASLATDGIDGNTTAAGGVADWQSLQRAHAAGMAPPSEFLKQNDSHRFLAGLGDLIITGPTGTNVMDLTLLVAGPAVRGQ